ncbi:MAG: hypothetical protein JWP84_1858 [Tardiphaga sp.]|nr:hypothetical protein [Tardiphaga sp.]
MRRIVIAFTILLASLAQAHASSSLACDAEDKAATVNIAGAHGRGVGSGLSGFRAEVRLKLGSVPIDIRKLELDSSHVRQQWFNGRDFKLATHWDSANDKAPYREVVLIVETRRGKAEESLYRGRYTLLIVVGSGDPAVAATRQEVSGAISCSVG